MESFWEHFRHVLLLAVYLFVGCLIAEFVFQIFKYDTHVPIKYLPETVAWILYFFGMYR